MSTIQMVVPGVQNGSVTLPTPSNTAYVVANGLASVPAVDVPLALQQGWTIMAAQTWPASSMLRMRAPTTGNWPALNGVTNGVILPDGGTATITAGVAAIPISWVNYLTSLGWSQI